MEEYRLDNELERIYAKLPFLWNEYNSHVKYITRDYGIYYRGFIIGLENDVCRLVFQKESNSPVEPIRDYMETKLALFTPPKYSYFAEYGWYPLAGLTYWLSAVEYKYDKDVNKDLENKGQYLKIYIDRVLDLFVSPSELDVKLEYHRNLHKEDRITVEKIREERARLQALGQDSSLEATIANLRGGRK